jgi:SCY1-like protein 1
MNLATNIQWSPEMQAPTEKALPALAESPNNAIDSWLIGCLIWTIYNNGSLSSFDRNKLKDMSHIPETLKEDYIKLLTGSPKNRLTLDRLLESPYFGTVFVQTCSFLEHLALKDTFEKEKFFKALPKVLPQFPDAMAKYKILPALTTGLDFGSVDHNALPVVLTIAAKLTPEEYKAQITASVLKWFALPDRTLRICLLQNIDTIIPHLDATQVASIWAPLSQGFTDGAPQLRELTVKSLVQLAPKLGERIINGDMLKFLAQLQVDPVPGIRCNTTVCLGKLANLMTPAVRQKVLLQAFSRALKDPFPPTRKASLAAMSHCHASGFFTPVDIAGKLVPVVAPMALDPELQVRQAALSGLNTYVQYLEQQSAKMPESAPVPGQPGSEAAGDSNAASLAGGMFDWALGKMLGSESTTGPQGKPATNGPASVSSSTTASAAHTTANTHSQSSARPTNSGGSHSASRPTSTSSISMGSSSSSVTPKSKTTPLSTSAAAAPGEVPWGEDDDFPSEPVGRPGTLPTNKQSNPPSHASLTPNSSSSSLGAWGETPHWSSSNSASTTLNSSIGSATGSRLQMQPSSSTPSSTQSDWDDVGDDSFSSPSVRPVATNPASSRGGMSLGGNKATKSTALSAWEDDADGDSGWGQDFTPTATALSRPGKTASHSRFG